MWSVRNGTAAVFFQSSFSHWFSASGMLLKRAHAAPWWWWEHAHSLSWPPRSLLFATVSFPLLPCSVIQNRPPVKAEDHFLAWQWTITCVFIDEYMLNCICVWRCTWPACRKWASSTSSTLSSWTWRRRPPSTWWGTSTSPTRTAGSAWAASAWRATPTPSRSPNCPVNTAAKAKSHCVRPGSSVGSPETNWRQHHFTHVVFAEVTAKMKQRWVTEDTKKMHIDTSCPWLMMRKPVLVVEAPLVEKHCCKTQMSSLLIIVCVSGGQKARVVFAELSCRQPDVLILVRLHLDFDSLSNEQNTFSRLQFFLPGWAH